MGNSLQRILVPVDFSPHSDRAAAYAATLARKLGASIELLHVIEDPYLSNAWSPDIYVPNVVAILETLSNNAELRLEAIRTATRALGVNTASAVRQGQPEQVIAEHAKSGHFDLIVMGTHGRTGLAHMLLGSVAERVLRHAPCAVLTLRDEPEVADQGASRTAAA